MPVLFISNYEILLRLGMATVCGVIFGMERKKKRKPVGARTYVLICLAACEIAIISAYGFVDSYRVYPASINVVSDPARLVVGILTGIGFIGAGLIYKNPGGGIQGITTASGVFLISVIGIGCGLGLYFLTCSVAVIAFVTISLDRIMVYLRRKKDKQQKKTDVSPTNIQ